MTNDLIGVLGIATLALFGFAVWPPLCLLVMGLALTWFSWVNR